MRIGWVTDIHLNFLSAEGRTAFIANLAAEGLEGLLIGGDIGEAHTVCEYLLEFDSALPMPAWFVLGNHDFYGGSIQEVRQRVAEFVARSRRLTYLTGIPAIALSADTALAGDDGWADGRLGEGIRSEIILNDYLRIDELTLAWDKPELFRRLSALASEASCRAEGTLIEAFKQFRRVVFLTHVPPFRESCWHEGRVSDPAWLPHFASHTMGEMLVRLMQARPDRFLEVLCGHTHSGGFAQILPNLAVRTGGAEYGLPRLQAVLTVPT